MRPRAAAVLLLFLLLSLATVRAQTTQTTTQIQLPPSARPVPGLYDPSRPYVAFNATTAGGLPIAGAFVLVTNQGRPLTNFTTRADGMAGFNFISTGNSVYYLEYNITAPQNDANWVYSPKSIYNYTLVTERQVVFTAVFNATPREYPVQYLGGIVLTVVLALVVGAVGITRLVEKEQWRRVKRRMKARR